MQCLQGTPLYLAAKPAIQYQLHRIVRYVAGVSFQRGVYMRDTRRIGRRLLAMACFLGLGMLAPAAFSQTITTADAVGVVSDTSGAVVPGAQVTIKSLESGESRTETTNNAGQYHFPLLKPGDYEISASAKGLKSNLSKITLLVGQAQEVNITMNPQG